MQVDASSLELGLTGQHGLGGSGISDLGYFEDCPNGEMVHQVSPQQQVADQVEPVAWLLVLVDALLRGRALDQVVEGEPHEGVEVEGQPEEAAQDQQPGLREQDPLLAAVGQQGLDVVGQVLPAPPQQVHRDAGVQHQQAHLAADNSGGTSRWRSRSRGASRAGRSPARPARWPPP